MNTLLPFPAILAVTALVSVLGLIGGLLLLWKELFVQRHAHLLVSFAAGSLLGAALLELLPEALEHGSDVESIGLGIAAGTLLFFLLEKFLILHHHSHNHTAEEVFHSQQPSLRSARPLVILGDALHNLLDGIVIAVAFLTDTRLGIITSLAVIAHELPQEIGDFSILLHSGMKKGKVFLWNFFGALVGPFGAIIALSFRDQFEKMEPIILAVVVGNFLYIALADLVPTIKHERKWLQSLGQMAFVIAGVYVVWQLGALLPHV